MSSGLSIYRAEVLDARRNAWLGDVSLAAPAGAWRVLWISLVFIIGAVIFIAIAQYSRREWRSAEILKTPMSKASSVAHGTEIPLIVAVPDVRPDFLAVGDQVEVSTRNAKHHAIEQAMIIECAVSSRMALRRCSSVHGRYGVILALRPMRDFSSIRLERDVNIAVRLPVDRQRLLNWLARPRRGASS